MSLDFEAGWRDAPADPEPWRFAARRQLLSAELGAGERWLDLGCGAGRFLTVAPNGIGVDVAPSALERAAAVAPGAELRLAAPGEALPLAHGEVDLIWCSEVIEHVPDALGLLQECRRVLSRNGRLLVTTPAHGPLRRGRALLAFDSHFDPLGEHVRFFTRRSLAATLAAAGLEPVTVRAARGTLVARARR